MADSVATQTIMDGPRNTVMKFTNMSDGTGESSVVKVDISTLSGAPSKVKIKRIQYSTSGLGVLAFWEADANVLAFRIPQDQSGELDVTGLIPNNGGTGVTGNLLFSTSESPVVNDGYAITLHMVKSR